MQVDPHALLDNLRSLEFCVFVLDNFSSPRVTPEALAASVCVLAEGTGSNCELRGLVFQLLETESLLLGQHLVRLVEVLKQIVRTWPGFFLRTLCLAKAKHSHNSARFQGQ